MMVKSFLLAALSAVSTLVQAHPGQERSLSERQSTDRLVFSHFMVRRSPNLYQTEIIL
jgi:hypothetical protein